MSEATGWFPLPPLLINRVGATADFADEDEDNDDCWKLHSTIRRYRGNKLAKLPSIVTTTALLSSFGWLFCSLPRPTNTQLMVC